MQVWFSNRRARLRKTLSSAGGAGFGAGLTGGLPSPGQTGSYSAPATEPSFSHSASSYQWPANPYLNYTGYCQSDKTSGMSQYYQV